MERHSLATRSLGDVKSFATVVRSHCVQPPVLIQVSRCALGGCRVPPKHVHLVATPVHLTTPGVVLIDPQDRQLARAARRALLLQ